MAAEACFHEEWFGEWSQEALAKLYSFVADLDGDVVEVGCWEGRSTIALARACHPHPVHAVDTWAGSPGEISEQLATERDVYATFQSNTEGLNIEAFRMDWREYFAEHAGLTRFLHVDATHSYDEVYDNVIAALPLMVPGGIICGDDVHHPPIQRAVLDLFPDARMMATLWWHQC